LKAWSWLKGGPLQGESLQEYHENLENRFIVNPFNGAVTGLLTMPLYIKMELKPFFHVS
jgi:hypothetical protein